MVLKHFLPWKEKKGKDLQDHVKNDTFNQEKNI